MLAVRPLIEQKPTIAEYLRPQLVRATRVVGVYFRLPAEDTPEPTQGRVITMCCWAGFLAACALVVGFRAFVGILTVKVGWYAPTVIPIGMTGLGCAIAAFASVHRRILPFAMLAAATAAMIATWYFADAA